MKIAPTSGHSLFLVSRAASCKAFPKRNGTTASSLQAIFSNFSKIIEDVILRKLDYSYLKFFVVDLSCKTMSEFNMFYEKLLLS